MAHTIEINLSDKMGESSVTIDGTPMPHVQDLIIRKRACKPVEVWVKLAARVDGEVRVVTLETTSSGPAEPSTEYMVGPFRNVVTTKG